MTEKPKNPRYDDSDEVSMRLQAKADARKQAKAKRQRMILERTVERVVRNPVGAAKKVGGGVLAILALSGSIYAISEMESNRVEARTTREATEMTAIAEHIDSQIQFARERGPEGEMVTVTVESGSPARQVGRVGQEQWGIAPDSPEQLKAATQLRGLRHAWVGDEMIVWPVDLNGDGEYDIALGKLVSGDDIVE